MINKKKIKLIIDEKIFESLFTYNIHTFSWFRSGGKYSSIGILVGE